MNFRPFCLSFLHAGGTSLGPVWWPTPVTLALRENAGRRTKQEFKVLAHYAHLITLGVHILLPQ